MSVFCFGPPRYLAFWQRYLGVAGPSRLYDISPVLVGRDLYARPGLGIT